MKKQWYSNTPQQEASRFLAHGAMIQFKGNNSRLSFRMENENAAIMLCAEVLNHHRTIAEGRNMTGQFEVFIESITFFIDVQGCCMQSI